MPAGGPTILLVEDDDGIRDVLLSLLEDDGYAVVAARNGQEALDVLAAQPLPRLLFLDLMMPTLNGWRLLELMAKDERLAQIPVVVFSAYADAVPASDFALPPVAILTKPVDLDRFLEIAHRFCGPGAESR